MDIQSILNVFEDFGYVITYTQIPDLAFKISQGETRYDNGYLIHYENRFFHTKYFAIYECRSVSHNGIMYSDPDKFHYFYSIQDHHSQIYHSDNFSIMCSDLLNDLVNFGILKKPQLREIQLSRLNI